MLRAYYFYRVTFALDFFGDGAYFVGFGLDLFDTFCRYFLDFPRFFRVIMFFLSFDSLFFGVDGFNLATYIFVFFRHFRLRFRLSWATVGFVGYF